MNSDPPQSPPSLPTAAPADVPSFGCVVYLSTLPEGRKRGRVANLADMELIASTEREVLQRIVPLFKKRVSDCLAAGEPIPWLDPILEIDPEEQKRFLPVHL